MSPLSVVIVDVAVEKTAAYCFKKVSAKCWRDRVDSSITTTVWRNCSWLLPQKRRTRREWATCFARPPTSRCPCHWGHAA